MHSLGIEPMILVLQKVIEVIFLSYIAQSNLVQSLFSKSKA